MSFNWKNRTMLIAEDDEMNFRYLEFIFSKYTKINMIWALNGQMAIDYCQIYKHIDIVIMDLQLPVVDGIEAARQIKSIRPALPVIAHTAHTRSDIIDRCLKAGCDEYVVKPVNFHELLSRIGQYLNPVATR